MADAQANINVNIDAQRALAQLKNLQRQISLFNAEISRGGAQAASGAARMQQNLVSSINATGQFSATMARTRTTTESFTNALEKNKFSMREYFRYAGGATQKFGNLFSKEMNVIDKVARERVKTLQTQYIKLGRDASGAMRSIAVRPLTLDMDSFATRTAMAAQKQQIFNQLLKQGSTNLLNWGKNTQWAGRQLMVGFTIPLAIFGSTAASSFMKLEEQAIKFKRVYGDLFTTPEQADQAFADMTRLGEEFTKYGVAVEETLGLAAKAAQMGNMGADLEAQVTEATRLAVLGGMEQQEALDTTISLTNAFRVATEDLTDKINFLNAAENQTILSIQDFNTAVPKAGSVVAQLGGDVEDLAFFLTAMREGGVNASQGANALKSSLGRLINPTQRARDALKGYGIDVVGIVEENQGNLRETVLQLGQALDQLDPLEKARAIETLFGKFQFARMSALFQNIMDEGSQASTILGLINSEAGELSQLAGKELGRVEQSAATQFRSAVEQFQVALAPIGESFIKLVTPVIEFGTKVFNLFGNLSEGAKAFVVGLVGVVGGIGPILLMTIGLVANGIANLMKGFAFFRERMLGLKQGTSDLGSSTQYMTQEQLEAATVAASLGQEHAELRQIFTSEKVAVDNLRAAYERMTAVQRGALGVSGAVGVVSTGAAVSGGKAKGFRYGKKVPGYKDGIVMVPGRKGEGDTQPAMLAPGEAVIPAKMAEKYGPLINAMIDGNIPGYSTGKKSRFAHIGEPIQIGFQDLYNQLLKFPESVTPRFLAMVEKGAQVFGNAVSANVYGKLGMRTGFTSGGQDINELLRSQGVDRSEFLADFESQGTERWTESVKYAGMKMDEVSSSLERLDSEIVAYLMQLDEAQMITDQVMQDAFNYAKANLSSDANVQNLAAMQNRAGEGRVFLSQRTADRFNLPKAEGGGSKGAVDLAGMKVRRGGDRFPFYRSAGFELVRDAEKGIISGVKQATKQASPSKAAAQSGRNIGLGAIQGIQETVDDAQAAGQSIGRAAVSGVTSGTGGPSARRVTVPGPITPTAAVDKVATQTKNFGRSIEGAAIKVAGMGAKIGTVGIGISSLIGGLTMIDGPLGEFTAKLFPIVSLMTGLSFALQMLNAETIKNAGAKVSEALASGRKAKADFIAAGASTRAAAASNAAAAADSRQAIASNAATRGLAAMTATSMLFGGGRLGAAVGNAVGKITKSANLFVGSIGRAANGLVSVFGRVGGSLGNVLSRVAGAVVGFGGFIAKLLGPVGLVVAGLALLAGGITLLLKVINDQKSKVEGLGDAANISAEKLGNLSEKLGVETTGARAAVLASAADSTLAGETSETKSEILAVKEEFENLLETDKEFKKEWKGTIDALKDGSQQAAQASMEMLAVSLQTEGYTKEQIQGVVSALLGEAGRTDVELEFDDISIKTQGGALDAAAQEFANSVKERTARAFGASESVVVGIKFDQAALDLFGETAASAIINLNAQFDAGLITLDEYEQGLEDIRQKIIEIGQTEGGQAATEAAEAAISALDPEGDLGLLGTETKNARGKSSAEPGKVSGLLDIGTEEAATAAVTVAQAEVAGVDVSQTDMATLEAGLSEDPTSAQVIAYQTLIAEIEAATEAQKRLNSETQETNEVQEAVRLKTDEIDNQTSSLIEQAQVYNDAKSVLGDYSEVLDKEAMARQIANDEELRGLFLKAQAADLAAGNTEQTDALISSLNDQAEAQAVLNAQEAEQQVIDTIADAKEKENALAGLTKATGDAALAQGILNNSMAYTLVAAKLTERGVTIASASADQIATAIEESGVLELINALVEIGGIDVPDLSGGTSSGASQSTPASFLDDIVKQYRDFVDASQQVTEGFDESLAAITNFAKDGRGAVRGLSGQLRSINVSEPLIEKVLGMSPEEWNKEKNKLFNFDIAGNLTGLTAAGQQVQDALNTVTISKFINEQDNITISVGNQITALERLTSAGASYEAAYRAVQNTAFAAAIATSRSSAEIQAAAEAAMKAQEMMDKFEEINEEEERKKRIRDAVRDMNKEFNDQANALEKIRREAGRYTDAQIQAIFGNKELRSLFLEPNIDSGALKQALANAERQADLELKIKKLTIEGQESIFDEGFANAMESFDVQERQIEFEFDAKIKDNQSLIEDAENQLALIDFELDDYEAGLQEIQWNEDEINKSYEKRFEALDKIADANDRIAESQRQQLDLADALSSGDIAAAARISQEIQAQQRQDAEETERQALERRQEAELSQLRAGSGLSRTELEAKILELEKERFRIEENTIEPAQEAIRLAEIQKKADIEALTVLGKTREQWEKISQRIDMATVNNYKFIDTMQEALDIVEELLKRLNAPRPAPPPPPPPPPPPSGGNNYKWEGEMAGPKGREARRRAREEVANRKAARAGQPIPFDKRPTPGVPSTLASGGMIIPKRMAVGGFVGGYNAPPLQMNMGGQVKGYPMGGLIPYKNNGGFFKSLGSDTVPAMLTPGEFVIRRPAVRGFGADKLEEINRGTYNDGSVYNYNLAVSVKSDADPDRIARTVISTIKQVDRQRIRGNKV